MNCDTIISLVDIPQETLVVISDRLSTCLAESITWEDAVVGIGNQLGLDGVAFLRHVNYLKNRALD